MSRKQSAPSVGTIGRGAESAHCTGQPNLASDDPELVTARSPEAIGGVGREAMPEWVRRRATSPEGAASSLTPEPADGSADFLTVAELAAIWRVSVRTLRRRLSAGQIPHIRVGRQVRIPRKAVLIG
jgi:excisionase family DNA binding protein